MARVLAGEKEEFAHLLSAYQGKVTAMILRQVGDREIARELVQETFVKAYRGLGRFRFEASLSTWITRIALNVAKSYFASRRFRERRTTVGLEFAENVGALQREAPPHFGEEDIERLQLCLGRLSPKYREVIVLCGFEQKSYEEAARILEVPVGTVRSRLNRARNALRKSFFEVDR